jgi:Zinc-binding loop region of homing endonuclease
MTRKILVTNCPSTIQDCWFVEGGESDTSGYPVKKIAKRGEANKWRLHRIMFFWSSPQSLHSTSNLGLQVAHRCGRGRYDHHRGIRVSCINPHHLVLVPQTINIDHNLCRRSCAAWCPHRPRCIYTNEGGKWLPCRNKIPLQSPCICGKRCFPEEDEVPEEVSREEQEEEEQEEEEQEEEDGDEEEQ